VFPGILSIVAAAASVNEGDTAIFNISTSNIPVGTVLTYEISTAQNGGLTLYADATDIKDNKVTGTFTIERGGTATIAIPILADSKTEGTEVLFVTTQGKSALTLINDIPGGDKTPPTIIITTPTEGQKRVPVDTEIKVTFSEPIQFGAGIITLKDESGSAVDVFNTGLKTDALSIQGSTLTLKPTATLKLYEQYTLYVGNSSIKDLSGNLFAESKPLTFKSATLDGLYHFFVAAFSAAPGATYMDQLADAYNFGLNLKQIVNIFTTKPQFTSVYPESLTNKDFATRLTESIVKSSASSSAKNSAITDIKSALDIGWSRGDVIFTVFGNLVSKPKTDPDWGATSIQFENQLKVSRYLTEDLQYATTDVPLLQRIISTVSAGTDVSTDAKIIEIIGSLPPGG